MQSSSFSRVTFWKLVKCLWVMESSSGAVTPNQLGATCISSILAFWHLCFIASEKRITHHLSAWLQDQKPRDSIYYNSASQTRTFPVSLRCAPLITVRIVFCFASFCLLTSRTRSSRIVIYCGWAMFNFWIILRYYICICFNSMHLNCLITAALHRHCQPAIEYN